MAVTPETVRLVAALASLSLGAEEVDALTAQLNGILEHMEALAGVETAGITPAAGGSGQPEQGEQPERAGRAGRAPLREDRPGADPLSSHPGTLAPKYADGFFTVPRLASHADAGGESDAPGPETG